MDPARIAALLHPFLDRTLPKVQLDQISTYIDLLLRWNSRINLTAIRDADQIVTRHFGESFFLARHLFPNADCVERAPSPADPDATTRHPITVLDIGSGAGFPGLPIKIWAPHISLTLVESNHKKAAFLREVIRTLTLTDVNVITARAETLTTPSDVVTLRAVEHFETILPVAARLASSAGRIALLIGSSQLPSLEGLGLHWSPPIPIPESQSRMLSISIPQ
jgi:16S rRNA (guanine527-N7)-methyltransferase